MLFSILVIISYHMIQNGNLAKGMQIDASWDETKCDSVVGVHKCNRWRFSLPILF